MIYEKRKRVKNLEKLSRLTCVILCGLCLYLLLVLFLPLWEQVELVRRVRCEEGQESDPKVDDSCRCRVGELALAKLEDDQHLCCNAADQKPSLGSDSFAVTTSTRWENGGK
jgi:hypothetical protein